MGEPSLISLPGRLLQRAAAGSRSDGAPKTNGEEIAHRYVLIFYCFAGTLLWWTWRTYLAITPPPRADVLTC